MPNCLCGIQQLSKIAEHIELIGDQPAIVGHICTCHLACFLNLTFCSFKIENTMYISMKLFVTSPRVQIKFTEHVYHK